MRQKMLFSLLRHKVRSENLQMSMSLVLPSTLTTQTVPLAG